MPFLDRPWIVHRTVRGNVHKMSESLRRSVLWTVRGLSVDASILIISSTSRLKFLEPFLLIIMYLEF